MLPLVMTGVAVLLVGWNVHLEPRMMLYDTGAPLWPFQVPQILLGLLNAPAIVLARPFENLFHAYSALSRGTLAVVATPLAWCWIGDRVERGLLRPPYRFPRLLAVLFLVVSVSLAGALIQGAMSDMEWWHSYGSKWFGAGRGYPWGMLLRKVPGILWCFAILIPCVIAAVRLFRRRDIVPFASARRDHSITLAFLGIWVTAFAITPGVEALRHYNHADESREGLDPDTCLIDIASGCVHGTVFGAEGKAIQGIYVEAIPLSAPPELRWIRKVFKHTDRRGRYSLDLLEPGDYLIGIHLDKAPTAEEPYAKAYYPAAETEEAAEHVSIRAGAKTDLSPLRLPKLSVTSFRVEVRWADGSHPVRSNLDVTNTVFQQATMRDPLPQIDDGIGAYALPQHFDYQVKAQITCDQAIGGQRETPQVPLHVTDKPEPSHVVLTLPGLPCTVR